MDTDIVDLLRQQGLTDNQTQIYLTLLQYGGSTGGSLSRLTQINRTTTYTALEEMEKKGRVYKLQTHQAMIFYAIDHHTVLHNIEKNYLRFKSSISTFDNIANRFGNRKIQLEYYEGIAGIKRAFEITLQSNTPIYALVNYNTYLYNPELIERGEQYYLPERTRLNIPAYCIVDNSFSDTKYNGEDSKYLRETRICSDKDFIIHGEINIFDHNKVLQIYAEEGSYYATIHTSTNYHNTMYSLFAKIRDDL